MEQGRLRRFVNGLHPAGFIDDLRLLVTDLEATGPDEAVSGFVEIGAAWMFGGGEFVMKCQPYEGAVLHPKAFEINGCDWHQDPTVAPDREAV